MSPADSHPGFDRFTLPLSQQCVPYEASPGSCKSSQNSIFSAELPSTQSSAASSISDDFRHSQEDTRQQWLAQQAKSGHVIAVQQKRLLASTTLQRAAHVLSYADVTSVPVEQRQHPRRSSWDLRKQKPPQLVRQCERKISFVENLVDSATQMVEVIWPLSVVPCRQESGNVRGVLPLRTYIEETLRRSRTSYSTLQVALYYLILIKPFVPKRDFTMEQGSECLANRALMCGRRMFLSALILASKYLQDRNYSAKAWSKMSGLPVKEINANERTYLDRIHWKLHIAETVFKRWTDVVLKYSPNSHPPSPGQSGQSLSWKGIVPLLTPQLDTIYLPGPQMTLPVRSVESYGLPSPATPTPTKILPHTMDLASTSYESTPTPSTVLPRFMEPSTNVAPPTPALARMGPLPTPQMTPTIIGSSTPAVSGWESRRPSMCAAANLIHKVDMNRCSIDSYPNTIPSAQRFCPVPFRRPSFSAMSMASSPESMISDRTRSSRASSISSVSTVSTTASMAPSRACLARQATCRNAAGRLTGLLDVASVKEEGSSTQPIVIADDGEMTLSPEVAPDFTISDKALHAPHRHSKHAPNPTRLPTITASALEKSRKRARPRGAPRGGRKSDLQDEIRFQLEQDYDNDEIMDLDVEADIHVPSPSPAAEYVTRMLSRDCQVKQAQPSPLLGKQESALRVPVQKMEGKKRTCCSVDGKSLSPMSGRTGRV
ncbi:hypothetical protein LTR62_001733 [Meristemomyces frigidus]|uniref:G1/S-specific cyclin pas1 n=1 Tax=Meristemomyces frigidus TaxID=1508187 RepID=A0AAN7TG02_9PEZI|nr:hypothetical protein LTR62_001733 [Meristemomyces frigidus]